MFVPHHLQDVAQQLALRSWVESKRFKRDAYFATVDGAKELLGPLASDSSPRDDCVVQVLAAALDEEGALLSYVLSKGNYSLNTDNPAQAWARVCHACGWVVLQVYELAVKKNEWPNEVENGNA